jgi:hypothetical protein
MSERTLTEREKTLRIFRDNKRLLAHLRELLAHVAVKDALGNPSLKFCRGCDGNHRGPCPVEKVHLDLQRMASERE